MMRLNLPYTDHREIEEIEKVLATGFFTQGPKVAEFEQKVGAYIGAKHSFAMSSCTTALQLALHALDLPENSEVLVADFTFPATANIVVTEGYKPVLVDINLDTFTMDPRDLERRITPESHAVIPVHAFGCSADMDAILNIAQKHNLSVIEDAACALATTYNGRFVGTLGDFGCFSFHPRKAITTGEGGLITTENDALAEKIAILRNHGGVKGNFFYRYEEAGYNFRLSDIQGAMGVAQMEKLDWILERKRALAAQLRDLLKGMRGITPPQEPSWGGHVYQSFVVMVDDDLDRDKLIERTRAYGIETTLGTYAVHAQPFYMQHYEYKAGDLPVSFKAFNQSLTLPLYPQMNEEDLALIARTLKKSISEI